MNLYGYAYPPALQAAIRMRVAASSDNNELDDSFDDFFISLLIFRLENVHWKMFTEKLFQVEFPKILVIG